MELQPNLTAVILCAIDQAPVHDRGVSREAKLARPFSPNDLIEDSKE